MTNLFIVAHVDDSELCCGGLIQKLISKGEYVRVVSLSHNYNVGDLRDEFKASMQTIGVKESRCYSCETRRFNAFENMVAEIVYEQTRLFDNVYTHDCLDRHVDHQIVAKQVKRVFDGNLFTFITPLNGDETPNYFVELSESQLQTKINALGCYESQKHRPYMSREFIKSLAHVNGIKCGKLYAEGFRVVRLVQ